MDTRKEVFSGHTEDGRVLTGEEFDKAFADKLGRVFSSLLSDQFDCDIKMTFVPKDSIDD